MIYRLTDGAKHPGMLTGRSIRKGGEGATEVGERVKMARLMCGMSQRGLAGRVGVSHAAIRKYEKGQDCPSPRVLRRLSDALGVLPDFFYRTVEVRLDEPVFRHPSKLKASKKKLLRMRAQDYVERLLEAQSLYPRARPQRRAVQLASYTVASGQQMERAADGLRSHWKLGHGPIAGFVKLLEDMGVKVLLVDDIPNFEAAAIFGDGGVVVILVNGSVPGDRERFSLAHELGHLLLKVSGGLTDEKAANRFAGALLAPREAVLRELGRRRAHLSLPELVRLKRSYGMSMQAWVCRARDLAVISRSKANQILAFFRKKGWHKHEPCEDYPREEPELLERLVTCALAEGVITQSRAAELLRVDIQELREKVRELSWWMFEGSSSPTRAS